MINDSERREIAARLRDAAARGNGERVTDGELVDVIAYACGVEGADRFDDRLLGRLADLIERPICKNLATKPADELFCSVCGEHVDIAYMESADDYCACYCPTCGAEVLG